MSEIEPVKVGRAAASVAEMVIQLVETAERYNRDWKKTLPEFIELRLQRFSPTPTSKEE